MSVKLEVCCGSVEDALIAQKVGAHRIELNCALEIGGLTPSLALFETVRQMINLPIMVMIRPHNGRYTYSELDFEVMQKDAVLLLNQGADGIVFGFLTAQGTIDEERVKIMVALAQGKETVFHKAIDEAENIEEAIQVLIRCKVDRILLGGGPGQIDDHLALIGKWQAQYGTHIQFLPGGGVHKDNIGKILEVTKIQQIHMTGKRIDINPKTQKHHVLVDETTLKDILEIIK